jgi:hypothetical protein
MAVHPDLVSFLESCGIGQAVIVGLWPVAGVDRCRYQCHAPDPQGPSCSWLSIAPCWGKPKATGHRADVALS